MRTPRFDIRDATRADAAAVAEIETLCFTSPWSRADILREIEGNELAYYIVCADRARVISYAGLWTVLNEGHITNVAVHPDFRGRGAGTAVLAALIERTRRRAGITDFTLEVRASNAAALRLYGKAGFWEEGRRKNYYTRPPEDAVIMWLRGS
ncbi:MAG: ribosomal protein S18-alanine N-acetyltransferase [Clostridiales Family XIII bacterium]|jgi:ribosomal-protein-alanine N-acetyltransferase|nr:ribosomal protein S18-alanine N-acetyltransferase [Clostridiales Family XIII bacterium]